MDITQAELLSHPLMKQVTADIAETREQRRIEQLSADMERQRLRAEHGRFLHEQYERALADYEALRLQTHQAVGRLWTAVQDYKRLTGGDPQGFVEHLIHGINVPTMNVPASPWAVMSTTVTTTEQAIHGWFASQGKQWL